MDKQAHAPIQEPFFMGKVAQISPIWQRWFQKLKTRDDEIRIKPYKEFTASGTLTTWELGKTISFNIGAADAVCQLPTIEVKDLWAWITIFRFGTGALWVTADSGSQIEYSSKGGSIVCQEPRRKAANVTLQIVDENTWAIIAGMGTWGVD